MPIFNLDTRPVEANVHPGAVPPISHPRVGAHPQAPVHNTIPFIPQNNDQFLCVHIDQVVNQLKDPNLAGVEMTNVGGSSAAIFAMNPSAPMHFAACHLSDAEYLNDGRFKTLEGFIGSLGNGAQIIIMVCGNNADVVLNGYLQAINETLDNDAPYANIIAWKTNISSTLRIVTRPGANQWCYGH